MRVLAMASQKGGSGKTTLSGHLAVQAQLAGAGPVCLIDIDPQGSLADWWNEREADMPAFAQTTVARLASDLEVLRQQGFRLAVVDTPPAITMAIQSVIAVAELIVIPTRPSPHDLRAVGATVDLLARKGAARPAMRPQGFGQVGNGLEDLGWNDMGFEPPKPVEVERDVDHDAFGEDVFEHPRAHPTGLTPVHSPVHDQQAEIVDRLNGNSDVDEEETDEAVEIFEAEEESVSVIVAAAPIAAPAPALASALRHAPRLQAALA